MSEYRFNVFGRPVAIVASSDGWDAFALGPDGKRRPAEFVVPSFIAADELGQYLGDLFHECATPLSNEVTRIESKY
ncbi:MAG: hypothetical protein V4634_03195 [Pseudomonadota bacterium]